MPWYVKCTRLLIALAAVMGCVGALFYGQISDAQVQQPSGDQSAQKAEDWPGQIRAYTAFAQVLTAEDTGARQDPERAQYHRPDYHAIIGITSDEVGAMWLTLLAADANCKELNSEFYTKHPKGSPQTQENADNGPELSEVDAMDAAAKQRQALADIHQKQKLAIQNAIAELKVQLGNDDFLRLDSWVHDHFASTQPVHHHQPQRH